MNLENNVKKSFKPLEWVKKRSRELLLTGTFLLGMGLNGFSQTFEGQTLNPDGNPRPNTYVKIINTQGEETVLYSDENADYHHQIVGMNDPIQNQKEGLFSYINDGSTIHFTINSSKDISQVQVYDISGKLIEGINVNQVGQNQYKGSVNLASEASGNYLFRANQFTGQIPFIKYKPTFTENHIKMDDMSFKANKSNKDVDYWTIIVGEPNGEFMPDTIYEYDVQSGQTYYNELQLNDWPTFLANIYMNVKGYENVNIQDAEIDITGDYSAFGLTDENGNISFENIEVGNYPANKELPDTLNINVTIDGVQWYHTLTDNDKEVMNENYNWNYTIDATTNDYIRNVEVNNNQGPIDGATWVLQNPEGTITYDSGTTNASGQDQIDFDYQYPGQMDGLEFIVNTTGHGADTSYFNILPGDIQTSTVTMTQVPTYKTFWQQVIQDPDLFQPGTVFTVVWENDYYQVSDTSYLSTDQWQQPSLQMNPTGTTPYTLKIFPEVAEGNIPMYPIEREVELDAGILVQDTAWMLEQDQKFYIKVYDHENQTQMKEANVTYIDSDGNEVYSGTTVNGIFETPYQSIDTRGFLRVTPIDTDYFGTGVVIDEGEEMTVSDISDLENNIGVGYKGYEYTMPDIQTNFDRTDSIAFYLVKQDREDPLNPGTFLTMIPYEISEMEANKINPNLHIDGAENEYYTEAVPSNYSDFITHASNIFGHNFGINEVLTERNANITDFSLTNRYVDDMGWNVSFGVSITSPDPVSPSLFGKATIIGMGDIGYDLSNWVTSLKEIGRKTGMNNVTSRTSVMNFNPTGLTDTLNIKDRVYFNLFYHYRPTQLNLNPSDRNITNLGYLFVPTKK